MATRLLRTLTPIRFASASVNAGSRILGSFPIFSRRFSTESGASSDSKLYIVQLKLPDGKDFANQEELESWYHSFLSGGKKDKDPRIERVLRSGFVARLSRDEAKALAKYDGFLGAWPTYYLVDHRLHRRSSSARKQYFKIIEEAFDEKEVILPCEDNANSTS